MRLGLNGYSHIFYLPTVPATWDLDCWVSKRFTDHVGRGDPCSDLPPKDRSPLSLTKMLSFLHHHFNLASTRQRPLLARRLESALNRNSSHHGVAPARGCPPAMGCVRQGHSRQLSRRRPTQLVQQLDLRYRLQGPEAPLVAAPRRRRTALVVRPGGRVQHPLRDSDAVHGPAEASHPQLSRPE